MTEPESKVDRKIIHVDMDAFYASVEQRDRPELRGRPVLVGGSAEGRGVVASASYEARRSGVRSAMSSRRALRLCPDAVIVPPRFEAYKRASEEIHEIFLEVTSLVEPLSLDEAYLEVTRNLKGEPQAGKLASWIKQEIRRRTGLTASAGAGPNKFVAKVASDLRKPDGLVIVPPSKVLGLIGPLPVERLWGVGPVTARRLGGLGLHKIEDLRNREVSELESALGKFGTFLHGLAWGNDSRPVVPDWDPKSSGTELTFERDVLDLEQLQRTLAEQVAEVCEWLNRHDCHGRTVTIKVRYADFRTITRSRTLPQPSRRPEAFGELAARLLREGTEAGREPIRLLGVSISGLVRATDPVQLWFEFPFRRG